MLFRSEFRQEQPACKRPQLLGHRGAEHEAGIADREREFTPGDRSAVEPRQFRRTVCRGIAHVAEEAAEKEAGRRLRPAGCGMEDRGFEPLTFWLPARRSPN